MYGRDWGGNAGTEVAAGERHDKTEVLSEYIVMFLMKNIQFGVLASMEGTPVSCAIAALAEQMLDFFFPDMELIS